MQGTAIERLCDNCRAPALYTEGRERGDDLCEECARWRGTMRHGEACVALDAIGFGISVARRVDLTDDQIRAAVERLLVPTGETCDYLVGADHVIGGDRPSDAPWLRTFQPLAESQVPA